MRTFIRAITNILHFPLSLTAVCFVLFASADAQEVSLSAKLDTSAIAYDGAATLIVKVEWGDLGPRQGIVFTSPPHLKADGLVIGAVTTRVSQFQRGTAPFVAREFSFILRPLKPGRAIIHPAEISYVTLPDSTPGTLMTPELILMVAQPAPPGFMESVSLATLVIVILIGATLLAGGVLVYVRRREKLNLGEREGQLALSVVVRALATLESATHKPRNEFYAALSDTLSELVIGRVGGSLKRSQTEAIVTAAEGDISLSESARSRLVEWLRLAAREKYTPGLGQPGETVRVFSEVEEFLKGPWVGKAT